MAVRSVYRSNKAGNIKNLRLCQEELPPPGDSEITVQVSRIGMNFADIFAMTGLYSATPQGSFIPGLEYSGTIIQKGKNANKWKIGDRVMGVTRFGAYATSLNINENYVYPLPDGWSMDEGASFITQALTAWYALIPLGNLKKGQTVLIQSAAGGVGLYAIQIAQKLNARIIGTVGSEEKSEILRKHGLKDIIIRSSSSGEKNFKASLESILNGGDLHLVLDCIGGSVFSDSYNRLSPQGRIIAYGSANFTPSGNSPSLFKTAWKYFRRPKIDPLKMISENKSVLGFNLIWLWDKQDELFGMLKEILAAGIKPIPAGRVFQFSEVHEAIRYFQSGKSTGKVIIKTETDP